MTFNEACIAVIHESHGAYTEYAKTYARGAMILTSKHDRKVQIPYILSNLQNWRGERARQVKLRLKEEMK